MGSKGYRLIKTGVAYYNFEYNPNIKTEYKVVYIGHKSYKNAMLFKQEQEKLGYTAFYKNINLNYSKGKIQIRPWAEKGGRIATTKTTLNKELLILCKEKDEKQ